MATFFPYNNMHNHNHPFNICSNNDLLLKQSLPYILIPSLNLFITLQPSRKRSDVDLVKSMDSTVVSNSPVDRLFCVVEDVSLRCVVCIIDTLDIQLMSARVDIRSTTNQHRENLFYYLGQRMLKTVLSQKFLNEQTSKNLELSVEQIQIHTKNINILNNSYCL